MNDAAAAAAAAPAPIYPHQTATLASGYTQQLQRDAIRCNVTRVLQQLQCCPPPVGAALKIQTTSGAHTAAIQKCYTFMPSTITGGCGGLPASEQQQQQPVGISAGGTTASQHLREVVDSLTEFNPERRFLQYKPYEYPIIPSTIIFTSPTIPVPPVDSCLLPGVNVSGPNPISAVPTAVTVTSIPGGNIQVSWTPGNDRSIVKYNVYVNDVATGFNITGTSYQFGPYPIFTQGTVQIEPVAQNNWRGPRSAITNWQAFI